jgi:meso-butanediol dehydrogenase/(S,S)-butanediol dehydrogenase/diacetyl reductase
METSRGENPGAGAIAHLPLRGMSVAITGAAQGIGRGIALRLACDGADIIVADLNEPGAAAVAEEVKSLGREAIAVRTDVAVEDDCSRMVSLAAQRFGRLDMLVCNAGLMQVKPLLEVSGDDLDRMLSVNIKGTYFCVQAGARQMLKQDPMGQGRPKGKIVTMSSIASRYGAGPMAPFTAPYRLSKAAVVSLTQSAAYAFAPELTVNAICPGLVETDMWKLMDKQWAAIKNQPEGEIWKQRVSAVPMGRGQKPEDVAGLAAYLAGVDSDYMTGQSINIEGGLTMS